MSARLTYFLGFIIIVFLLSTSAYLQIYQGIMPCPLCSLQRVSFALLGILFLIGLFLSGKRWGRISINLLAMLASSSGLFFAGRQIWLQQFPSADNTECGVSLHYMMQMLPLKEVMQKVIAGSAECTDRGWEFLHLNMPEWAFFWFSLFFVAMLYLIVKELKK